MSIAPSSQPAISMTAKFSELDEWFRNEGKHNRWVKRIEMRFVIDNEHCRILYTACHRKLVSKDQPMSGRWRPSRRCGAQ
jgi:hypothetical protein